MRTLVLLLMLAPTFAGCAPKRVAMDQGACRVDCAGVPCLELIAMEGCPHAAELGDNVCEAVRGLGHCCCQIDPAKLPADDPRRGYPSPSIILDGKDLFGLEPVGDASNQCRRYPDGLPTADAIRAEIKARQQVVPDREQ